MKSHEPKYRRRILKTLEAQDSKTGPSTGYDYDHACFESRHLEARRPFEPVIRTASSVYDSFEQSCELHFHQKLMHRATHAAEHETK